MSFPKNTRDVIPTFEHPNTIAKYIDLAQDGFFPKEKELVHRYFSEGCLSADLGCGTGRTTLPLKSEGYLPIGIDITFKMVQSGKQLSQDIPFVAMDATNLGFPSNYFCNAIFSFAGWNEIPGRENRQEVLNEVYRVMKEGGNFILSTHLINPFNLSELAFWGKKLANYIFDPHGEFGDLYFEKPGRPVTFTHVPTGIEVYLGIKQAGFNIQEIAMTKEGGNYPIYYFICTKK